MSGSIAIEQGRIRAVQDNLQGHESCEFSQDLLDSLVDEIYEDYLEYDSSENWNYMGATARDGSWPVAHIRLDDGERGIGICVFIRTEVTDKRIRSLKPDGARTNASNARMFHLALLESIGMEDPYLWRDAWLAGEYLYPIQKENLKEILLKNLEKVIKEES